MTRVNYPAINAALRWLAVVLFIFGTLGILVQYGIVR